MLFFKKINILYIMSSDPSWKKSNQNKIFNNVKQIL